MVDVALPCLYFAHSCTEHRPWLFPSGSEGTPHENCTSSLVPGHVGGEKHFSPPTRSGYEARLPHTESGRHLQISYVH